jgi:hypothetical protein
MQRASAGSCGSALGSSDIHLCPCTFGGSRRCVSSSSNPDHPCGRTASAREESGHPRPVLDLNRTCLSYCDAYPPLTCAVDRARGPPSASPTRHSSPYDMLHREPEGPRATPSRDSHAASPLSSPTRLGTALIKHTNHAYRAAKVGGLLEGRHDARATLPPVKSLERPYPVRALRRLYRRSSEGLRKRLPLLIMAGPGRLKHHSVYTRAISAHVVVRDRSGEPGAA